MIRTIASGDRMNVQSQPFTLRSQRTGPKPATKKAGQAPAVAAARKAGLTQATTRALAVIRSGATRSQEKLAAKMLAKYSLSADEIIDMLAGTSKERGQ